MTGTSEVEVQATTSWRRLLGWAAVTVAILEAIDAFLIEFPVGALVFAAILLVLAWRIMAGTRRWPVVVTGLLLALELVMMFTVYDAVVALGAPESWLQFLVNAGLFLSLGVGVIAAVPALRQR